MGVTRVALRAGTYPAAIATSARHRVTSPKITGSVTLTPNTRLWSSLLSQKAPTSPVRRPIPARMAPWASTLRRTALSMLKNESSLKVGVKNKRLVAGWDEAYLEKVLLG